MPATKTTRALPIIALLILLGYLAYTSFFQTHTPPPAPQPSTSKNLPTRTAPSTLYNDGQSSQYVTSEDSDPQHIAYTSTHLPAGMSWTNASLSIDPNHYVWSNGSLLWKWQGQSTITIQRPIPWMPPKAARAKFKFSQPTQNCFVVWIYNKTPHTDAQLRFNFYSHQKTDPVCFFNFGLNFTGWRMATVSYDRDMQGTPTQPLQSLTIESPPNIPNGSVRIGDLVMHKFIDARHQHGDYQVPFVRNADQLTSGHWDPIMHWYDLAATNAKPIPLTDSHKAAFQKLKSLYTPPKSTPLSDKRLEQIEERFAEYNITKDSNGIRGAHIYMLHHLEAAPSSINKNPIHTLKYYTNFMKSIADTYAALPASQKESPSTKRLETIFCLLTEHLLDQGFAAGSSLGTMHHFGYNTRAWVPAIQRMQEPLAKAGLLSPAREALVWFYNSNQMYAPPPDHANMDYLNTLSKSDFTIQSLGADDASKAGRLQRYSDWLSASIAAPASGKSGGIKPDGSLFHHAMHYHGYGVPALRTVVDSVVGPLDNTPFEISPAAYARLKSAFLSSQFWAFPYSGFNACGRHPITHGIESWRSPMLTLALSPPGSDSFDRELAAAYLAMFGGNSQKLFNEEIHPTQALGFYPMNYNAGATYKCGETTLHLKGYGNGIKSHETYGKDNRYGRYLSHGTIQIYKNTTAHTSGQTQDGYDWSRLPGATTLKLPLETLEGSTGFYGASPKQQTHPSGAGHLKSTFGAFLFQLDPSNAEQSLKVRKSVFAVDNVVVCLGSNISNKSDQFPTQTTLFQASIPSSNNLSNKGKNWYIDPYGTAYFIPNTQNHQSYSGPQQSRHNKTKATTKGDFSLAWIDHGTNPSNAQYIYYILPDSNEEKLREWATTNPITVVQQDDVAHTIRCKKNKLEATTVFRPFSQPSVANAYLQSIDRTAIVLTQKISSNKLDISITDINLPDIGTAPSPPETSICIRGHWTPNNSSITHEHRNGNTHLNVPTHRGQSLNFSLQK
ncbi:chondroitinase family polysaccharide lyase [Rubritalea tangerina]|uniref:Chondroitinase family polysaccharide lyase n=1 Tax=Rubritalea tangerina TaxID=430798 RepID=A0ABW4ZF70_9BACT